MFVLKQELTLYDYYQACIADCDRELEGRLKQLSSALEGVLNFV